MVCGVCVWCAGQGKNENKEKKNKENKGKNNKDKENKGEENKESTAPTTTTTTAEPADSSSASSSSSSSSATPASVTTQELQQVTHSIRTSIISHVLRVLCTISYLDTTLCISLCLCMHVRRARQC